MKRGYKPSERGLCGIKYKIFINKKAPESTGSEAFLRVRCEEVKNLVKHINHLMRQYWHKWHFFL